MAIGDIITASDYNNIRTDINSVIGKTTNGYGQDMRSAAVAIDSTITSEKMRLLYLDLMSARIHQTGTLSTTLLYPEIGNLIAWETSTAPDGARKGLNDFISVKNLAMSFDNTITPFSDTSFSLSNLSTSTRNGTTTPWGTASNSPSIVHTVTLTFTDVNQIQYFFNAGGQVRFLSSITGGSGSKTLDWVNMLSTMGTVAFNKTSTVSLNNSGTGTSIGYTLMTTTYQTVYTKVGSSVYSDNMLTVEARKPTATTLQFRVTFNDADVGTSLTSPVDESVNGTITSTVQVRQPNSSYTVNSVNYTAVVVTNPSATVQTNL